MKIEQVYRKVFPEPMGLYNPDLVKKIKDNYKSMRKKLNEKGIFLDEATCLLNDGTYKFTFLGTQWTSEDKYAIDVKIESLNEKSQFIEEMLNQEGFSLK
jgi:hypothetical protein